MSLKAGQIARIRVNPKDCQSVLDLLDILNIPYSNGMSFSQAVSVALGSLLETARQSKMLPEPDAFQFLNRMQRFTREFSSQKRALEVNRLIGGLGERFQAPVLEMSREEMPAPTNGWVPPKGKTLIERLQRAELHGITLDAEDQMIVNQARQALSPLNTKKEQIEDGMGGLEWTQEDQQNWAKYYPIVYPFG